MSEGYKKMKHFMLLVFIWVKQHQFDPILCRFLCFRFVKQLKIYGHVFLFASNQMNGGLWVCSACRTVASCSEYQSVRTGIINLGLQWMAAINQAWLQCAVPSGRVFIPREAWKQNPADTNNVCGTQRTVPWYKMVYYKCLYQYYTETIRE